jgi:hypothetical protein
VRKLSDGSEVMLKLEEGGGSMSVISGRSSFRLQCLPQSDFPELTAGSFSHTFRVESEDMKALIEKTQFAISTEETRYYLNGIYLHAVEADGKLKLRAVATDGHRLARAEVEAPAGSEGMPGIIIPRKTVSEILKLVDDPDVGGGGTFRYQDQVHHRQRDPHLQADRRHLPRLPARHPDGQRPQARGRPAELRAGCRPRLDDLVRARPRGEDVARRRPGDARRQQPRFRQRDRGTGRSV